MHRRALGGSRGQNGGDRPASAERHGIAALGVPSLGRGGAAKGRHPDLSHVAPLDGPKGTTGQDGPTSNLTPSRRTRRARAAWLAMTQGRARSLRVSNSDGLAHVARSHQRASTPRSAHGFLSSRMTDRKSTRLNSSHGNISY